MFYEIIRRLLCPFYKIEKFVPKKGEILDVGCGHGTFDEILAQKSKKRNILGIDPSKEKIQFAQKRVQKYSNLSFKKAFVEEIRDKKFDAIVIIDVLYLFTPEHMIKFLKYIKSLLTNNGVVILKTDSREPKILHYLLSVEEFLMVKLFKFTYSNSKKLYFLNNNEYKNIIKRAGYKIIRENIFTSIFPYRHPTYLLTKS